MLHCSATSAQQDSEFKSSTPSPSSQIIFSSKLNMLMACTISLWVVLFAASTISSATQYMPPSTINEAYSQDGDLIIGALYSARGRSNDIDNPCGGPLTSVRLQQNIEAVAYYINMINKDSSILPNITVGYRVLDDCRRASTALAKCVQFLSITEGICPEDVRQENTSAYGVVGVVGATSSQRAQSTSLLLGMSRIPLISPEATSDQLSDDFDHAYFFRLVPPDMVMAQAIISLLTRHGWYYMSLLFEEGSYGKIFADNIKTQAEKAGVCIAYSHMFPKRELEQGYFERVVFNLKANARARVVVLILDVDHAPGFFAAVRKAGLVGQFQWIGGDTLDQRAFVGYEDVALGAITFTFPLARDEEFANHMYHINPWNSPSNPWLRTLWSNVFDCNWINDNTCFNHSAIGEAEEYYFSEWTSRTIDSVMAMLIALDQHVKEDCAQYIGDVILLRCCVRGSKIREKLRAIEFNGTTGTVKFDDNGNLLGDYLIRQLIDIDGVYTTQDLGRWVGSKGDIELKNTSAWYVFKDNVIMKSLCSDPCSKGFIYVPKTLPCCWDCFKCRENEILVNNATECVRCPTFSWPDQQSVATCEPIWPTYIRPSDAYGITLMIIALAGIIITIACTVIFVRNRNKSIIKATNRSIMYFIFSGVYLSFCSALLVVAQPNAVTCSFGHVGFHLSCTLLYGPLCVKTMRIQGIVNASNKFRQPKYLASEASQVGLTAWISIIQVVIIFGAVILSNTMETGVAGWHLLVPTEARLQMPISTEPLVELYCKRPWIKMMLPLSLNALLLLWGSVLAFKTRHLPEAYNEAWYIYLSVSATLVIWGAFIPAYFLMFYAYYQETLLSLALSLSGICHVALLFLPKVYAAYYVDQDKITSSFSLTDFGQSRATKRSISSKSVLEPHICTTQESNTQNK